MATQSITVNGKSARSDAASVAIDVGEGQTAASILKSVITREPNNYDARVHMANALANQPHGRDKHDASIRRHLEAPAS